MPKQAAYHLRQTEQRIALQIDRIKEMEGAGRWPDARQAREMLAVMTETRDALRLRLRVASDIAATEARWAFPRQPSLGQRIEIEAPSAAPGKPPIDIESLLDAIESRQSHDGKTRALRQLAARRP